MNRERGNPMRRRCMRIAVFLALFAAMTASGAKPISPVEPGVRLGSANVPVGVKRPDRDLTCRLTDGEFPRNTQPPTGDGYLHAHPVVSSSRYIALHLLDHARHPVAGVCVVEDVGNDRLSRVRYDVSVHGVKVRRPKNGIVWARTAAGGLVSASVGEYTLYDMWLQASPPGHGHGDPWLFDPAFLAALPPELRVSLGYTHAVRINDQRVPGRLVAEATWADAPESVEYRFAEAHAFPHRLELDLPTGAPVPFFNLVSTRSCGEHGSMYDGIVTWDGYVNWRGIYTNTARTYFSDTWIDTEAPTFRDHRQWQRDLHRFEDDLKRGHEVVLRCVDADGTPFADTPISVTRLSGWRRTDADGRRVVYIEPPRGEEQLQPLTVWPNAYAQHGWEYLGRPSVALETEVHLTWPVPPGTVVPVVLTRTATAYLRFLDPAGAPVTQDRVAVAWDNPPRLAITAQPPTADGWWRFDGLPPGATTLRWSFSRWGNREVVLTVGAGQVLRQAIPLADTAPQVVLHVDPWQYSRDARWTFGDDEDNAIIEPGTIPFDGMICLGGLSPGSYTVVVRADDPGPLPPTHRVYAETTVTVNIPASADAQEPQHIRVARIPGAILQAQGVPAEVLYDPPLHENPVQVVPAGDCTVWGFNQFGVHYFYSSAEPYDDEWLDGGWLPECTEYTRGLPLLHRQLEHGEVWTFEAPSLPIVRFRWKEGAGWDTPHRVRVYRLWQGEEAHIGDLRLGGLYTLFGLLPNPAEEYGGRRVGIPPCTWILRWCPPNQPEREVRFDLVGNTYDSFHMRCEGIELPTYSAPP